MNIGKRIGKLEARQPEQPQRVVRIISPRADMTDAECDAFKSAELKRRGEPPGTFVIFRRIVSANGGTSDQE